MDQSRYLENNVGTADSIVRVIVVIALWIWPEAVHLSALGTEILGAVGWILLVTAITRDCGLYKIFGLSTMKPQIGLEKRG